MTLQETIAVTKQTAEGVKSCESVLDLARRHGVDMPITETVVGHRPRGQAARGRAQGADVAQRQAGTTLSYGDSGADRRLPAGTLNAI